jgi:hypothetical protein
MLYVIKQASNYYSDTLHVRRVSFPLLCYFCLSHTASQNEYELDTVSKSMMFSKEARRQFYHSFFLMRLREPDFDLPVFDFLCAFDFIPARVLVFDCFD